MEWWPMELMRSFHGKDVGEIFDLGRLLLLRTGRGHVPTPNHPCRCTSRAFGRRSSQISTQARAQQWDRQAALGGVH